MLKRLPRFPDIVSVYAVIASMLFAWAMLLFFWYVPSWLHFMSFDDLFSVFCYVMASSFIESISFLSLLLAASFFLPQKYLRDEFVPCGTAITLCAIGLIMLYDSNKINISLSKFAAILVLSTVIASFLSTKIYPMRKALIWLSDRLTVFLYILIPLSVLSIFAIIIRNIS